jgi:putative ABC transport system permease protein
LLVAGEPALGVILLIGAGLMVKSFWEMYKNPPGFAPESTLIMKVSLSGPEYADKARQTTYFRELLHRLESMPGIRAYGIANIADYIPQTVVSQRLRSRTV